MDNIGVHHPWKCALGCVMKMLNLTPTTDMKFVLLHEAKNDDGIKGFFYDVWELYMKVSVQAACATHLRVCIPMRNLDDDESFPHCAHPDQKHGIRYTSASECEKVPVDYIGAVSILLCLPSSHRTAAMLSIALSCTQRKPELGAMSDCAVVKLPSEKLCLRSRARGDILA
jgi:hypothetical protein